MIRFGNLLAGSDADESDIIPEKEPKPKKGARGKKSTQVTSEDAPPPPGKWIMDPNLRDDDFESPGLILNPLYDLDEEDIEPREARCGRCRQTFTSTPIVWRGKNVFTPTCCAACSQFHGERVASVNLLNHPEYKRVARVKRDPYSEWNYFCGFYLNELGIAAMNVPNKMSSSPITERSPATTTPNNKPTTGPSGHARYGPSSLKHREICPHWENTPGTNPAAEEGTMLHERLVTGDHSGLNEEQKALVESVANIFALAHRRLGEDVVIFTERRVNVANLTWGTADEICLAVDRAIVPDAKFGRIEVDDAEDNLQGWSYAVGVFYEFPKVKQVEVMFVQPRTDMVSSHVFYRDKDYGRMRLRIATVIARAEDPDAPFNPQPQNCIYCGNKAKCQALHALALKAASNSDGFSIPDKWKGEQLTNPEMMARALFIADVLEPWIEDVKVHARQMLFEGGVIPGYELGERSAPRSISNASAAWEATKDTLTIEQFVSAIKSMSVPELEKLFAANAKRGEKGQAKQALEDRLIHSDAMAQDGAPVHFLKKQKIKTLTQ